MTTKELVDKIDGPVELRIPDLQMTTIQRQIDGKQLVNPLEISATTLQTPVGSLDVFMIPAQMIAPAVDTALRSRFGVGITDIVRVVRIVKLLWTAGKGLWDAGRKT